MILLALFVPMIIFWYPETSGVSLEEIDNLFLPADKQVRKLSYSVEGGVIRNFDGSSDDEKRATDMVEKV